MAVTDDKPSIAELQRIQADLDQGTWYRRDADTLRAATPVLLEIAAAALALESEMSYLQGPLSARLRAAISKVRP